MSKEMKIELWDIERLVPYDKNVKKHPADQVAKIATSLKSGWDQPIVVDANGVIIKGHGRRLAAISLGLKKVPVFVRDDLDEEQVRAARLNDNRAAMSDIDTELLRLEMADLNLDLLKGVFDDKELAFTLADLGEMNPDAFIEDLDAAVEKQTEETAAKAEALKKAEVPLIKALGFKSIPGEDEIHVARFLAECERRTGKKGRDAFLEAIRAEVSQ